MMNTTYPVIDMEKTGSNIRKLRQRSGFKIKEMYEFFGFSGPQAIYKWQRGETLPSVDNLLALSMLFHVTIDDILVSEDEDVLFLCLKIQIR